MISGTRVVAAIAATAAALGLGVVLAQSPSDFDGVFDVTIRNGGSEAIHGPVAVEVRAQNLVDGGYIEADGSDIMFASDSNAQAAGIAPELDSNEATWWWYADVEADSAKNVRLFAGGPETDPLFPLGDDASIEVPDSNSLDITDDLVLEATIAPAELPESGQAWAVSKQGSFGLGVDSGGVVGFLERPTYVDIAVDGAGDYTNISGRSSGCSANWECVDHTDTGTYATKVWTDSPTAEGDAYTLADPDLASSVRITSVQAALRYQGWPGETKVGLRLDGVTSEVGVTCGPGGACISTQTIDRPGGGSWSVSDLGDLQATVEIHRASGSYHSSSVVQVYVRVHYMPSPPAVRFEGIDAGAVSSVRMEFDDPTLDLYVNDSLVDTVTSAGAAVSNTEPVVLGGDGGGSFFRGGIGNVRIGDTSGSETAYALDLRMRPAHITPGTDGASTNSWAWTGTIADQSDADNDATFGITYDPTDVEVEVGPLVLATNRLPGQVVGDTPDLIGDVPVGVFLTPGPVPTPSKGRTFLVEPLVDAAEGSGMPAEAWWILVGTLTLGPATALGARHFGNYPIMAIVGVLGIFVISMIAGLGVWWVAFSALWKAGMIGIKQYWRSG